MIVTLELFYYSEDPLALPLRDARDGIMITVCGDVLITSRGQLICRIG